MKEAKPVQSEGELNRTKWQFEWPVLHLSRFKHVVKYQTLFTANLKAKKKYFSLCFIKNFQMNIANYSARECNTLFYIELYIRRAKVGVSAWPSWDKAHADVYVFFFQPKFLHAIILARNCSTSLSSVSSLIELGLWRKLGHSVQSPSRSV